MRVLGTSSSFPKEVCVWHFENCTQLMCSFPEKDTLKLALRTKDADGNASTGWWQKHDTGIHKSGFNPDGHPIFVPLFNLKNIGVIRTRYRDSPFPELEDRRES